MSGRITIEPDEIVHELDAVLGSPMGSAEATAPPLVHGLADPEEEDPDEDWFEDAEGR